MYMFLVLFQREVFKSHPLYKLNIFSFSLKKHTHFQLKVETPPLGVSDPQHLTCEWNISCSPSLLRLLYGVFLKCIDLSRPSPTQ